MTATILIADDEPMVLDVLTEWLRSEEMRVVRARNGREALEKAQAVAPDLLLLDVMMPVMDGFEVCRRLRRDPRLAEVPVILITALNDRESRIKGLEAGADDFLSKPYDGTELRARVRTIAQLNRYRRLLAERAKFEWVVEQSESGYALLDGGDGIVYANASARIYLGRPAATGEPLAERFLDLARAHYGCVPAESWESWPAAIPTPRYLVRPETASAESFWLRVEALELPAGHDARYLVRLRDETSKVVLKRDMWKFSSLVAHKLRTPLTTVLGGLELLGHELDEAPKEELARFVEMAKEGARRLKEDVGQVLASLKVPELARTQVEGFDLGSLPALAREIGNDLELAALSIEAPALGAGQRLALSPVAFELVLRELLENAKKFHPRGSPSVEVRAAVADKALRLNVADDGTNVPPELLSRVWAPYFQSEKGFSGSIDGMGLGLSVVASVVWGVGGSCRIHNQDDGPGVVVELEIPLAGVGKQS